MIKNYKEHNNIEFSQLINFEVVKIYFLHTNLLI